MATLSLSPQVFSILAALIEEKIGLHYAPNDRELLAEKVSVRAVEAGFESLLDYYYYVRYDDPDERELRALTETLVVGETYFFREAEQLQVIVEDFLAPLVAQGRRPRVWSAACATGEEPLSLAMLLAERDLLGHVDVVATDINERSLAKAKGGKYGRRSVRAVPMPAAAQRWLRVSEYEVNVEPHLAQAIEWKRLNLMDQQAITQLGLFDVVLCRNVLIYFRDETASRVVRSLGDALRPGGALFVGISESLLRFGTYLTCEERGGIFLYRKGS